MEDMASRHIYDSVDETQDEEANEKEPSSTKKENVKCTFDIDKEIKHANIIECDENPYYEEVEVSIEIR